MPDQAQLTVSRDRWEHLPEVERSWIMYESHIAHISRCESRFCKLESRKLKDTVYATIAATIAAIATVFGLVHGK